MSHDDDTLTVALDVDRTLIHGPEDTDSNGNSMLGVPRYTAIDLYRVLEALGCDMYIWSGGGEDHAREVAQKLGLSAKIVPKGSFQPDIAIDDKEFDLGVINLDILGLRNDHLTASFDINGTLIYSGDDPRYLDDEGNPLDETPRYPVLRLYEILSNLGLNMIIWTSHGKEYAELWKKRLGLPGTAMGKDKEVKPDLNVDNHDDLGKINLYV
jgi:hypothetical protein